MKQHEERIKRLTRNLLLFVIGFLAAGAICGGGLLIISPSGELIGMPLTGLQNSVFHDFLIPGIILFSALGLFPAFLIYALIRKPESQLAEFLNVYRDMHWSWTFTIYLAFILIGWIQIQQIIFQSVYWLHTFYMFYGVAILIIALLPPVRNNYKR